MAPGGDSCLDGRRHLPLAGARLTATGQFGDDRVERGQHIHPAILHARCDTKGDYGAVASTTTPERVASNGTSPGIRGASTSSVTVPLTRSYNTTLRVDA